MFCTKCGFQIKDGYKFCPKCGTSVYVEKEAPKSEEGKDVNEVNVEAMTETDNKVKPTSNAKNAKKTKASSMSKKTETEFKSDIKFVPDSLIAKELDIEGVLKEAENGDEEAMLRQAFRYENGIGCIMNKEKAASLYEQVKDNKDLLPVEELYYKNIIGIEEIDKI